MHTLPPFLSPTALRAPYQLRPQHDADDAFAATLYRSSRDDLRMLPGDPAFVEQLLAMQQRAQILGYRQAYPQASYLVLEREGTAIGRLVLDHDGTVLRLVDIAILPEAQNHGGGGAVLRGLQALAGARQWRLELGVNKSNLAARRLYQRLGFRLLAEDALQEQLSWSAA